MKEGDWVVYWVYAIQFKVLDDVEVIAVVDTFEQAEKWVEDSALEEYANAIQIKRIKYYRPV